MGGVLGKGWCAGKGGVLVKGWCAGDGNCLLIGPHPHLGFVWRCSKMADLRRERKDECRLQTGKSKTFKDLFNGKRDLDSGLN